MTAKAHHSAICARDVDTSLRFYREGIGLDVLMDEEYVDVDAVLEPLAVLGLGGEPRRITVSGPDGPVPMATVRDPDGVLVELIGVAP